jgi:phosphatidylglycerol:prolipoprotein diacylglycerol transferase
MIVWVLMRTSAAHRKDVSVFTIDRLMFLISIWAVLGGRLGEVILFDADHYAFDPRRIFMIADGGMSFHGGYIGVLIAVGLYSLCFGTEFWRLADLASAAAPSGLLLGRVGNFLNGELYGPETTLPWGIVFSAGGDAARHPTQLYEMVTEGGLLLALLYPLSFRVAFVNRPGIIFSLFLISFAIIRIGIEPVRLDEWTISFFNIRLTAGQIYSLPMMAVGIFFLWSRSISQSKAAN